MKRILIISDGKPGHLNQSIAFCKIKNIDYDIKEVKFKSKFHKSLSYIFDKIGFFTETLFQNDLEVINLELYDGIISTGSGTYYFNKLLAKKYDKKSIAKENIVLLGFKEEKELIKYMQEAKAFLYAAIEDFGIVPIEALSCGTPVIALNQGGTAETIRDGISGVHFQNQTKEDIVDAVRRCKYR
jgi:glycosyltransferase involved in cell wall biosynthesis